MCPTFHLLLTVVVSTRRECLCYYGLIAFIILWQTLTGLRVCVCVWQDCVILTYLVAFSGFEWIVWIQPETNPRCPTQNPWMHTARSL